MRLREFKVGQIIERVCNEGSEFGVISTYVGLDKLIIEFFSEYGGEGFEFVEAYAEQRQLGRIKLIPPELAKKALKRVGKKR